MTKSMRYLTLGILATIYLSSRFSFENNISEQGINENLTISHTLKANSKVPVLNNPGTSKSKKTIKIKPTKKAETMIVYNDNLNQEKNEILKKRKSVGDRYTIEYKMTKDPKTGLIPFDQVRKARELAKKVPELVLPRDRSGSRTIPNITTTSRGPSNYGGRTRALAFDFRDENIVLAGGVSSGIFRSTNNGANWVKVTPNDILNSITALKQDPVDPDTWYAGSGEKIGNSVGGEGADYSGDGMVKSTDNGLTWTVISSTRSAPFEFDNDFDYISKIEIDPLSGWLYVVAGETVKRSINGGDTWTNVLGNSSLNQGLVGDIIYNDAIDKFFVSIHGQTAATTAGVYRGDINPTTRNVTWVRMVAPTHLASGGVGRIVLANYGNTEDILVYYQRLTPFTCTIGGSSSVGLRLWDFSPAGNYLGLQEFSDFISSCAGNTPNPINEIETQEGYNMCITTRPDLPNMVYLGGTNLFRFNPDIDEYRFVGGDQGSPTATNLHVDQHLLVWEPFSNNQLWACNDGGMRKTVSQGTLTAAGYNWTDRNNNYLTYQYYRGDINPTGANTFLAGAAQDNAFTIQPTGSVAAELLGGDGTCISIISGTNFDTGHLIAANQNGSINRVIAVNGSGDVYDIQPTGKAQDFKTYFHLDKDNTIYLYYPTNQGDLYRTRIAATIINGNITTNANTGWERLSGVSSALLTPISAMATTRNIQSNSSYSASNSSRKLYVGTENGQVLRLVDPAFAAQNTAPTNITPAGGIGGYVSSITVNPTNDNEVLLTYSNYNTVSVWHSTNANAAIPTWTNVEGPSGSIVELTSVRSSAIVNISGGNVYVVGTSTGLYGTTSLSGATTSWTRIAPTQIGLAPSLDLKLRPSDNKMSVATHGSGLFLLEFPTAPLPINLLTFTARKNNDKVEINWSVEREINFNHFNVLKSNDGKIFSLLEKIDSRQINNYTTFDLNPIEGVNFYRLEMVDFDGKKSYSDIVHIEYLGQGISLKLYPNITAENFISLDINDSPDNEYIEIQWFDILGKLVQSNTYKIQNGRNTLTLNVENITAGKYFLKILSQTNGRLIGQQPFVKIDH